MSETKIDQAVRVRLVRIHEHWFQQNAAAKLTGFTTGVQGAALIGIGLVDVALIRENLSNLMMPIPGGETLSLAVLSASGLVAMGGFHLYAEDHPGRLVQIVRRVAGVSAALFAFTAGAAIVASLWDGADAMFRPQQLEDGGFLGGPAEPQQSSLFGHVTRYLGMAYCLGWIGVGAITLHCGHTLLSRIRKNIDQIWTVRRKWKAADQSMQEFLACEREITEAQQHLNGAQAVEARAEEDASADIVASIRRGMARHEEPVPRSQNSPFEEPAPEPMDPAEREALLKALRAFDLKTVTSEVRNHIQRKKA